ncbi:unnamed protein product [Ceutorhynchus assimilis]|uniref:Fatty acyl-CoA reductase n=1 Tax=Ceutorhynchus assimilis TaxID=467358 RepID=A0A9P0DIM3_9CUCU|nr:unnamed protein product [Ceutorhynchus assimilis]
MGCVTSRSSRKNGKNIFITGGSGFIGKALIEKLLRSCPGLGNIYVLLRSKKGKTLYSRVEQILNCPLFTLLKQEHAESLKKIIPIQGDITEIGFALSANDESILINEVDIFFHIAASVKFDDFLKDAILTNIRGTREAASLALKMKRIEVFMHVSTAYCNVDKSKYLEEILYPSRGDWKEALLVAENCNSTTLSIFSQKYISQFPNTYTYTKQLAEHCVNDMLLGEIPTVIFRPSVVVSTITDPMVGWIDNFNGPVGLAIAAGSGLLRCAYGDGNVESDYIPVDNAIKLMISAAWNKASIETPNELQIYHGSKYKTSQFKFGAYITFGKQLFWDEPFENKIWTPAAAITTNWLYYFLNVILFQIVPALLLDTIMVLAQLKPRLFKIQRKIYVANMALYPFMLNEWQFINTEARRLLQQIPRTEMVDFNFNVFPKDDRSIYEYYLISCSHARVHLLKENKEKTNRTIIKTLVMYYLDKLVKVAAFLLTAWTLLFKIDILQILWKGSSTYWDSS